MKTLRELAEWLHNRFCILNHTDRCGWDYERNAWGGDDWNSYHHEHWLTRAKELNDLANLNLEE